MSTQMLQGDCREVLPTLAAGSVQCVITSPPYFGLRDYGTVECRVAAEQREREYEASVARCLDRDIDGTFWAYGCLYPLGDKVQGWGVWLARQGRYESDTNVRNWTNDYSTFEGTAGEEEAWMRAVALNNEGQDAV